MGISTVSVRFGWSFCAVHGTVTDRDGDVQNVVQSDAVESPAPSSAPRALTQEELDWFSNVFFAPNEGDEVNIRAMFLNTPFERPEDIVLYHLFWYGLTKDPDLTAEEQAMLGNGTVKLAKITSAEMDAVLTQYLGLTLLQTS